MHRWGLPLLQRLYFLIGTAQHAQGQQAAKVKPLPASDTAEGKMATRVYTS